MSETQSVKQQPAKYGTLKKLFNAVEDGKLTGHVSHYVDGKTGIAYLTSVEGRGRGVKPVLLWSGPNKELIAQLLKQAGVKVKAAGENADEL